MRKPNERIIYHDTKLPKNQIGKRFSKIFDILMDPGYYEGTKYAKYFNRLDDNGKSKIYVYDPLEKELDQMYCDDYDKNQMKYLVGLAGMGKTTLLRNYFSITDRDVVLKGNSLIIYISFYYSNLSEENCEKSIINEINRYIQRAIKLISKENRNLFVNKTVFFSGFYDFIIDNKPTLLEDKTLTPSTDIFNELLLDEYNIETKMEKINFISEKDPLDYCSLLLKYITSLSDQKYTVTFVFDDIEAKKDVFHKYLIETARHVFSCLNATIGDYLTVKTIVSLRAYTFRCNVGRTSDARRENLLYDTILKSKSVSLHEIFEKRFKEIEEIERIRDKVKRIDNYKSSLDELQFVEKQLDTIGSNLVYNIVNYNLCDAMVLYSKILTNLEWIACNEKEYAGAFQIDAKNYRLTSENIMYSISKGNSKSYFGFGNTFMPNILDNEIDGNDLYSMYIIRYLINKNINVVYGEKYADAKDIVSEISDVFTSYSNYENSNYWTSNIENSLIKLYESGIVLRSLYDIEESEETQIERIYKDTYKLYLSPRGKIIYDLFSQNAILLELYRDDIYTNLPNNDKLTDQLSTYEIFIYIVNYLNLYFEKEKGNIGVAIPKLHEYYDIIGSEFITSHFLEGVLKNINAYYKKESNEYSELINLVKKLSLNMKSYSNDINEKYGVLFKIATNLRSL